jgi:outer membrane immunogenic protein
MAVGGHSWTSSPKSNVVSGAPAVGGGLGGGCGGIQGARIEQLGLLSARLGSAWENWLVYTKGGAAVANSRYVFFIPGVLNEAPSDVRWGWVVGAGGEYGITRNWSFKVEYDYVDLGTRHVTLTGAGGLTFAFDQRQQLHIAKLGINYRFGSY